MKIIDIGICVDNNDPKGLGRIRYIRYLDWIAQKDLPNILHKNNTELLFHPERPEEYEIMLTTDRSDRP